MAENHINNLLHIYKSMVSTGLIQDDNYTDDELIAIFRELLKENPVSSDELDK